MLLTGCGARPPSRAIDAADGSTSQVANLHAFARLYGILRWFHPSDAAAIMDWDRFAIEGSRRVRQSRDRNALRTTLAELIAPFAPTVRIATSDELRLATVVNMVSDEQVAWEHVGFGDSSLITVYASKRRHRTRTVAVPGAPAAELSQVIDATALRGARVRFRGKLRVASPGQGRLTLRVDRGDQSGFADTMAGRPVVNPEWEQVEIIGKVDLDATKVHVGTIMTGGGTVWYDSLELAVESTTGAWLPVELEDGDFEAKNALARWRGVENDALEGWKVTLDHDHPASGATSLRVEPAMNTIVNELFPDAPNPGETVDVDLGSGLHARVPITLSSRRGHTLGDDPARVSRATSFSAHPADGFDWLGGVADVIVAWNALEHFWPYWDLTAADWNAALDDALRAALSDRTVEAHQTTLRRLSAVAADGHAGTSCPGSVPRARPPFLVDVVENQVVVTATGDQAIAVGDVIVSLDGKAAADRLADGQALVSGSSQWRRTRARSQFGMGPTGSKLDLRLRRGTRELEVSVPRGSYVLHEFARPAIERLADDTYYVDLSRAELSEIDAMATTLAAARGVVFDLRAYPNVEIGVLSYLLTRPARISAGMAIPHVIRPDHVANAVTSWETSEDELPPREPHFRGRVAFLTGPGAISLAETMLAMVERDHLGAIVGSPTAGTNGNIAEVILPTGCRTRFTGLRVNRPDGSRFHLIGIQPTIPVGRTIAGVAAGRDEVLERGLAYVRTGQ
jgi:C-terminal processing protease CtpA/Prc